MQAQLLAIVTVFIPLISAASAQSVSTDPDVWMAKAPEPRCEQVDAFFVSAALRSDGRRVSRGLVGYGWLYEIWQSSDRYYVKAWKSNDPTATTFSSNNWTDQGDAYNYFVQYMRQCRTPA